MMSLHQKLKAGAKLLEIIDRRRFETGNAGLGSAIERAIIDACLAQLEEDWLASGDLPSRFGT